MREILFRGRHKNSGKWYEGLLCKFQYSEVKQKWSYIIQFGTDKHGLRMTEVDPKTIGQYTGLKDKNGKKIFEGDIVRNYTDFNKTVHGSFVDYEIVYRSGMWQTSYIKSETGQRLPKGYTSGHFLGLIEDYSKEIYFADFPEITAALEIIGNINDKELSE